MSLEEIEARRAARRAVAEEQRREARAVDMEAMDALEAEHGCGKVVMLDVAYYKAGLPTCFIARAPAEIEYRRFRDMIRRDKNSLGKAADMLSAVCVVYPDVATRKLMLAEYPGLEDSVATKVISLVEGAADESGKG